ncbi:MAG: LuxR C-terminal-related transcriptional regulator [Candidatus Dormibacteraceae bacterium]
MSSRIARAVVSTFRGSSTGGSASPSLSPREEELLRLLAKGHRSKEIADEIGVGLATVNTYARLSALSAASALSARTLEHCPVGERHRGHPR